MNWWRGRLWLAPAGMTLAVLLVRIVPVGLDPRQRLLGHPHSDLIKHYWNLWWFRTELLAGRLPYSTQLLNFPDGLHLYPIEPLNMVIAVVLEPLLGLTLATNLIGVLNLTLAGVGMYLLIRQITGSFLSGLLSGLLFATSSYALWTLYVGIGELTLLGLLPLALATMLRSEAQGDVKTLLLATGVCFGTAFSSWYHALFLLLSATLVLGGRLLIERSEPRAWLRTFGPPAVAALLLFPVLGAFQHSYQRQEHPTEPVLEYVRNRSTAPAYDNPDARIDMAHLVLGGFEVRARAIQTPYVGGRYLGVSLLLLALLGSVSRPRAALPWLGLATVALLLGCGSRLVLNGEEAGGRLPFHSLNLLLERLGQPMNFPARFMMPLTLAVVVLAGLGLAGSERWGGKRIPEGTSPRKRWPLAVIGTLGLGCLPVGEGLARGDLPLPMPSVLAQPSPVARALAVLPDAGAVLELPQLFQSNSRHASDEVLLLQRFHGRPSASLPLDRITMFAASSRQQLARDPLVMALMAQAGLTRLLTLAAPDPAPESPASVGLDPALLRSARQVLVRRGFAYLMISLAEVAAERHSSLETFLHLHLGPPVYAHEGVQIFRLAEG